MVLAFPRIEERSCRRAQNWVEQLLLNRQPLRRTKGTGGTGGINGFGVWGRAFRAQVDLPARESSLLACFSISHREKMRFCLPPAPGPVEFVFCCQDLMNTGLTHTTTYKEFKKEM